MANIARLELLVTMLKEVDAGTWKCAPVEILEDCDEHGNRTMVPGGLMPKLPVYFDLSSWVSHENNPSECGFAACAIGHACLDQRFIDQGLYTDGEWPLMEVTDEFGTYTLGEWVAVSVFFDIPEKDAYSLFSPGHCLPDVTAGQGAEKVEAYIAGLGNS